jgi:hypothetical protein
MIFQKSWSNLSWFLLITLAISALMIISSCTPESSQVVEDVEQSNDRSIATDQPEIGSSDGLNDEESEGEPPKSDRSENKELNDEQGEERDSEIEAEDFSPEPTAISRSDRLTPTDHLLEGVERVPDLGETPVVGEVPQDILKPILEDVHDKSGADIEDVKVIRAENIIWPDGSMGCGKPGEMYTQAQVPGYWVVLEVNGDSYDYRVTENGYFNICDQSRPSNQPPAIGGTPDM